MPNMRFVLLLHVIPGTVVIYSPLGPIPVWLQSYDWSVPTNSQVDLQANSTVCPRFHVRTGVLGVFGDGTIADP